MSLKLPGVTCRRSGCAQTYGSNGRGDTCGLQEAAAGDKLFHGKNDLLLKLSFVFIGRTEPARRLLD